MKPLSVIAVLLVAATFIPASSSIAQDHVARATVPFNFTVGNSTVPAGTYRVTTRADGSGIIQINSWDKNVHLMSLAQRGEDSPASPNALVFHRYGSQYFLADIRSRDSAMNVHFSTSKAEQRAKAHTEEASLRSADPVLVALR